MDTPTAKRFILELLSAAPSGDCTVVQLARAGQVFAISDNSIRVSLSRLSKAGLIQQSARGTYQLAGQALQTHSLVMRWRSRLEELTSWDGSWIVVQTAGLPRSQRAEWRLLDRRLRLLALAEAGPGLYVRPNNLAMDIDGYHQFLQTRGAVVLCAQQWAGIELQPQALWSVNALNGSYRKGIADLHTARQIVDGLPPEQAAGHMFQAGAAAIRQILLDPLLPDDMVDAAQRQKFIQTMIEFDIEGREAWRLVMGPPQVAAA